MAYNQDAINQALKAINTGYGGIQALYEGGQWYIVSFGKKVVASPDNAATFQSILDNVATNVQVRQKTPSVKIPQTPYTLTQSAIQQQFGKSVAFANNQWFVQNSAGALRPAGANLSAIAGAQMNDFQMHTTPASVTPSGATPAAATNQANWFNRVFRGRSGGNVARRGIASFLGDDMSLFAASAAIGITGANINAAHGLAGIAGTGIGLGTAGAGALIGGIAGGGIPGALAGGTIGSTIGVLIAKGISAITGLIGSIVSMVTQLMGQFVHIIGSSLHVIIGIGEKLFDSLLKVTQIINQQHLRTGMPLGVGLGAAGFGASFGLSPEQSLAGAQGEYLHTQFAGMIAGVSAPFGSRAAFNQLRARFGRSLEDPGFGGAFSRSLVTQAGYGEALASGALTLPQGLYNRQAARGDRIIGTFGITPDVIQKTQQDFGMLLASVKQFVEMLKIKIASELLPYLTKALDSAIEYMSAHAGDIVPMIQKAVGFIAHDLPIAILNGLKMIAEGTAWFLGVMSGFAHDLAGFFKGLQAGEEGFGDLIGNILKGFDYLSIAFNEWVKVQYASVNAVILLTGALKNAFEGMETLAQNFAAVMARAINAILTSLQAVTKLLPAGIRDKLGTLPDFRLAEPDFKLPKFQNPIGDMITPNTPTTDLFGAYENYRNSKHPLNTSKMLDDIGDKLGNASKYITDNAIPFLDKSKDSVEQLRMAVMENTNAVKQNTDKTNQNTDQMDAQTANIVSRTAAFIAEDYSQNLLGISTGGMP